MECLLVIYNPIAERLSEIPKVLIIVENCRGGFSAVYTSETNQEICVGNVIIGPNCALKIEINGGKLAFSLINQDGAKKGNGSCSATFNGKPIKVYLGSCVIT